MRLGGGGRGLGALDGGDGGAAFGEARAGRLGDAEGDGRVGRARGEVGGRVRVREVAAPGRDRDDAGEARGPRGQRVLELRAVAAPALGVVVVSVIC